MTDIPIAIPWYETEVDYLGVLAMLPASERQDPFTHDIFMSKMKRQEEAFKRQGLVTIRCPIEAVTLKEWCDANNLPVCRQSITEYGTIFAGLTLKKRDRNN